MSLLLPKVTRYLEYQWVMILFAIILLFAGLNKFRQGFLISKPAFVNQSECFKPPPPLGERPISSSILKCIPPCCWMPRPHKQLRRLVLVIVDALRYNFAAWNHPSLQSKVYEHVRNQLPILNNVQEIGGFSKLFDSYADPPTVTFQRLKALGTGSLPTILEAALNFDLLFADKINYNDTNQCCSASNGSLFGQLAIHLKGPLVFLGDDTWKSLYGNLFSRAHFMPSFDVWDLHTLDNAILEILPTELKKNDWSVLIAHFLGVDHAGHRYSATHPETGAKLRQMNDVISDIAKSIDNSTLLVVLGDHGMDDRGDHGGQSKDETSAAMWLYSRLDIFSEFKKKSNLPLHSTKINQIDLVPTLALLLGVPIPFENLGKIIPDVFPNEGLLSKALEINAAQIHRYLDVAGIMNNQIKAESARLKNILKVFGPVDFMNNTLKTCRELWAQFDIKQITVGLSLMLISLVVIFLSFWLETFFLKKLSIPEFLNQYFAFGHLMNSKINKIMGLSSILISLSTVFIYFSNSFVQCEDCIINYLLQSHLLVKRVWPLFQNGCYKWSELFYSIEPCILLWVSHQLAPCHETRQLIYCPSKYLTSKTIPFIFGSLATIRTITRQNFITLSKNARMLLILLYFSQFGYWILEEEFFFKLSRSATIILARLHLIFSIVALCVLFLPINWIFINQNISNCKSKNVLTKKIKSIVKDEERSHLVFCIIMLLIFLVISPEFQGAFAGMVAVLIQSSRSQSSTEVPHLILKNLKENINLKIKRDEISSTECEFENENFVWNVPPPHVAHLLLRMAFFASGHQAELASVQWNLGFTGLYTIHIALSPFFIFISFIGAPPILLVLALILRKLSKKSNKSYQNEREVTNSTKSKLSYTNYVILVLTIQILHMLASSFAAAINRHELHSWTIFGPRWILASIETFAVLFAFSLAGFLDYVISSSINYYFIKAKA